MRLKLVPMEQVDPATRAAKSEHHTIGSWMHTQCWAWEGGDAIVVLVKTDTWVVLRDGTKIKVVEERGVVPALKTMGFGDIYEVE